MANEKSKKKRKLKYQEGLRGAPIFDDFGRIVGFDGEPPLPEPIDMTELMLASQMVERENLAEPLVANNASPEAIKRALILKEEADAMKRGGQADPGIPQQEMMRQERIKDFVRGDDRPVNPLYYKDPSTMTVGEQNDLLTQYYGSGKTQNISNTSSGGWDAFVQSAAKVAKETGYPLQVLLGQAAIETGRNPNAAPGNNWFGIKGRGTSGTQNLATKEAGGDGGLYDTRGNFAAYESPEDSIKAYIDLIKTNYVDAWNKRSDPNAMIQAIKAGGYATDPNYVNKVMSTPEFRNSGNILGARSVSAAERPMAQPTQQPRPTQKPQQQPQQPAWQQRSQKPKAQPQQNNFAAAFGKQFGSAAQGFTNWMSSLTKPKKR